MPTASDIARAPVRCPACGGSNVVAGDPTGVACDDCGHKALLKAFRREAADNPTAEQKAKATSDMNEFLGRFMDVGVMRCDRFPDLPVRDTALRGTAGITHAHGDGMALMDCAGRLTAKIEKPGTWTPAMDAAYAAVVALPKDALVEVVCELVAAGPIALIDAMREQLER